MQLESSMYRERGRERGREREEERGKRVRERDQAEGGDNSSNQAVHYESK